MESKIDKNSLLSLVKVNNLMELFPLFVDSEGIENGRITPSQFIKEMNMTTEERYKKLIHQRMVNLNESNSDHPGISITPRILVFQSFTPNKSYSLQIQVRNCRKVIMPLKMMCPESSCFSAKFTGPPITKVAPGLSVDYEVTFTPKALRDYNHNLNFKTDEESFDVPLIAIGPRPLLDIPDEIIIPPAPVKIPTKKVVLVRNIGSIPADFSFISSGCFKVQPAKGSVGIHDILHLTVIFESSVVGQYSETLYLSLDTGEKLTIKLSATAENASVRLDKNIIIHDDTFVGLKRYKSFNLVNNTQCVIKFSWKRNKTVKEDLDIIERMRGKYEALKDLEIIKDMKQGYYNLCSRKEHELAWERICSDELRLLQQEEFQFQHPNFKIDPESGEVFPKTQKRINTVFQPTSCKTVSAEAYLEVFGRDERLTLQMKGLGLGPHIVLSVETLDIDFIFLCSVHTYEVIAINKGDIPGTIMFKQEPLVFGGKVEVTPNQRHLIPSEHAALIIAFTSNRHGDFTEKINFVIVESGDIVSLVLKGKIVSPTLHFDKTQIDFGVIPVGFPASKEVTLSNLSMVPVTFSLRILSEGNQPSISYETYSKLAVKPSLPKTPKEFKIDPMEGVVEPYSGRTVTLTLTPNIARKWATHLMVDMWDSETESVSCPIRFNSQIATVKAQPSVISIPFCFINFPYTRLVTLENTSKISAFFYMIPQNSLDSNTVTYSTNTAQGVIEPKGTAKVSLTIQTKTLGRQILPLNALILGSEALIDICQICCVGHGPVVTVKPNSLAWGEIPLLEENTKYLTIMNESPIPANFSVSMSKSNSPWTVSPSCGILSPEEKITLNVSLLLRDRGKFQDVLRIQIINGKTLSCTTNAVGVGNNIVMQPNIAGVYDLGVLFSHKKYSFDICIKNEGTKMIGIVWCPIEDYKAFVNMKFLNRPEQMFKMEPTKIDLAGGCSRVVSLEVYSAFAGTFSQKFYLHANADMPTKELFMMSEVTAEFVDPLVKFDKTELIFYQNIGADGVDEKLSDVVTVTNVSVLPLTVNVSVNYPFYILESQGEVMHKLELDLGGEESKDLTVAFNSIADPARRCHYYKDKLIITFKEHSKKASVVLVGEVNYPNIIVLPRVINFECIPVGTSACREFILVNISPVVVNFRIFWEEERSVVTDLQKQETVCDFKGCSDDGFSSSAQSYACKAEEDAEESRICMRSNRESEKSKLTLNKDEEDYLTPPRKPVMTIPEIEIKETDIKNMLFPLVRKYYKCEDGLMDVLKSARSSVTDCRSKFAQLFDFTPFYGRLDKYESQVVMVCFQPDSAMTVRGIVCVEIDSGPKRLLNIMGMSANLEFSLDKVHIDFGRQLFCETASEYLRISNTSLLEFDFETDTVDPISLDANEEFPIEAGILIISPRMGHVPARSEKVLRIRYHPGLPGKFEEKFQLRIGYLDPINILVSGYGVFPQVHVALPRCEMAALPVEIGYAAVASITPEWFLTRIQCDKPGHSASVSQPEGRSARPIEDERSTDVEDSSKFIDQTWTVISRDDYMPSVIDIDLAVERILAFNLLSNQENCRSSALVFLRAIPHFFVPAYEVDFGVVTVGRAAEETLEITNYGPLPAVLFFTMDRDYKSRVMHVSMKSRSEIRVGGTCQVTLSFDPKRSRFSEQYEKIEYTFHFEVYQGARIPIKVYAVVTYPFIIPSVKNLNFNEVKCGNCKVMCMKLKNVGWVPASWSVSLRLTSQDITAMHSSGFLDGRSAFHFGSNKGMLFPKESCLLKISFKPNFGGKFSAPMIIRVEEGYDEHRVLLLGEGIEARLKISETAIAFEPTLPYPKKLQKCFSVQNPCTFPVEFYLPDFDEQIYEEESVIRSMILYYQTNELLLPCRNPGDKIPPELFDFHNFLVENMNNKYAEKARDRKFQSEDSILEGLHSIESMERKKHVIKIKRGSSNPRPRSSVLLESTMSLSHEPQTILKDKTLEEIEDMLAEHIRGFSPIDLKYDPVQAILDANTPPRKPHNLEPTVGLIIILHAAPHTNITRFTRLCSSMIHCTPLDIDRIVLEEVAHSRCDAAIILRGIIEQTYADYVENKLNAFYDSNMGMIEERGTKDLTFEDLVDDLQRKLVELFFLREGNLKSKSAHMHEEKANSSGSTKKEGKLSTPNAKYNRHSLSVLDGYDDLVYNILKYRLQIESFGGVLIESLASKWVSNPVAALKVLIRAAGNITDILVICLVKSLAHHREYLRMQDAEEEEQQLLLREEGMRILEEDPEEDFIEYKLDPEVKKELRVTFLHDRHEAYNAFRRLMEERARLRKLKKRLKKKGSISPVTSPRLLHGSSHKEKEKAALDSSSKNGEKSKDRTPRSKTLSVQNSKTVSARRDDEQETQFLMFEQNLVDIRIFLECWDRHKGISVEPPSPTKQRKSVTPDRQIVLEESTSNLTSDVGVPLWLLDENSFGSSTLECVSFYLNQILTNRRISYDPDVWSMDVPDSMMYTVVTSPPRRHPSNMVEVFQLSSVGRNPSLSSQGGDDPRKHHSLDKLQNSDSFINARGKKWSEASKARVDSRGSVAGKTGVAKKMISSSLLDSVQTRSRWVLQEGESVLWCVHFSPSKMGRYEQSYPINVMSAPANNNIIVKCTGICDIPRLDMNPENIFSSIAAEKPQDLIYSPTFFYSTYHFDFGSVIPSQSKDESRNRELHAIFSLTNISSLPVELDVMFADDALRDEPLGSPNFDIEPKQAYLKPDQTFLLNVYANPSSYGIVQEVLMLFVKGNPKIETIRIKCYGVRVSVNIEPRSVDFDRMLLYRSDRRIITFTNCNFIPLFLALSGYDKLPPQFKFSSVKSWVQPLTSYTIEIEYNASEIQLINEEVINVLVYDRVETMDPVQTMSFTVSAEAYDASVEIFFASKEENHVDFEEIRIQNECKKPVTLKNTGKYMLGFKIEINCSLLEANGNEEFYVTPNEGKLPVGKPFPLTVNFQARSEVSWKRLPLFKILLKEPYNKDELVASIPIEVSAKSFFSRYTIVPNSELNMGPVQVDSQKTVTISIENKGHFSFTYSVEPVSSAALPSELDGEVSIRTPRKGSEPSSKDKTKKPGPGSVKMGAFDITPNAGVVDVRETAVVSVTFSPIEVGHIEESVLVRISEIPSCDNDRNILKIIAEGCLPELNLDDYDSIFREHYVKKTEKDLPYLPDVGYYTSFTVDTKQFCFKNVCLGKMVEGKLHLENKGQIDSCLTLSVSKPDGKRSRNFAEVENEGFWVTPSEMVISPYASRDVAICFQPEMLQNYKSQLTLSLIMPEKYGNVTSVIGLCGTVCTPQIDIVEPVLRSPDGQGLVNFPPTTPSRSSSSVVSFRNTGKIESKVVLEVCNAEEGVFSLYPKESSVGMLKAWEMSKPITHTTLVTVNPGETAEFDVHFKPKEVKKYACEVRLFVIDNGFENVSCKLYGEAFFEEVVLERIQTTAPFATESSVKPNQTVPGHYFLNLGHCFMNKKKQVLARLANKTEREYFRFEWEEIPASMSVHPQVGHLYPGTYKEILFAFLTQEAVEMDEVPLTCSLTKISFPNSPCTPAWDARAVHFRTVAGSDDQLPPLKSQRSSGYQDWALVNEVQVSGHEPEYEVIPNSSSELILHISAVADYARLHCETTTVNFADTFMFQNRFVDLPFENTGNVAFDYTLELKSVTREPIKTDQAVQADPESIIKFRKCDRVAGPRYPSRSQRARSAVGRPKPLGDVPLLEVFATEKGSDNGAEMQQDVEEETYNPIRLENPTGTLMPKEKANCRITFSPLDVSEYKGTVKIKVDNIHPEQTLPEILITARSIMPYCHFDVPESDYIESGRRDYSRPGPMGSGPGVPLDPHIKTIEVKILGVRVTRQIRFYAINPTDSDYSFSWVNVTQSPPGVQPLHCTYTDGVIQSGRQKLMEFAFLSQAPGTFEHFYKFCIPQCGIETVFLFVIVVQEPVMYFQSSHLVMRPTSIGATVNDVLTLVNQDDVTSDFFFLPDSLYSEGRLNSLKVTPLSGTVVPKSEINFRLSFTGKAGGRTLFLVKCKIKKLQRPVTIVVETMTYSVEPLVMFEDSTNTKRVAETPTANVIDFGKELQVDRIETATFYLTNTSKLPFCYEWVYDKKELVKKNCALTFSQLDGHVTAHSRAECDMTMSFSRKSNLANFPVKLKILRGPVYNFLVNASATSPGFEFSFLSYDFGYCYLQKTDFPFYETTLVFQNKDKMDLLVDSSTDDLENFTFQLTDNVVSPGKELAIPIRFFPRNCQKYEEKIHFVIASSFRKTVTLTGHGTDFKVTMANLSDANIHMGATRIGSKHSREFTVVNKGLAKATILVGFADQLPVSLLHLARPEEYPVDLSMDHRLSGIITLIPSKPVTLRPKESYSYRVEYSPEQRTSSLVETVYMQFQERVDPIGVVSGSAIGPEFSLDRKYLTFGAVVANYSSMLKLKIINSGDIGARFKWETDALDEFSISPEAGYLSPESNVVVEVTFHPTSVRYYLNKTVECKIFISDTETFPSLSLKLSGGCVDLPHPITSIPFRCDVRDLDVKTIQIFNRTGADWRLMPSFSGEYFDGLELLRVPSMSSTEYEIAYRPLTMTKTDNEHKGSLFFCLPDGTGQLYDLLGTALPPPASEVIVREIPCKTKYTELLKVKNWLRSHQRFRVTRSCAPSDSSDDLVFTCSGCDMFEIPPAAEKEYKLTFYAYKVGKLHFTVTFTNVDSGEYVWYDITFNIVMCGPLDVITLKSGVRQLCLHALKLENPLTVPVQFKFECWNPDVFLPVVDPVPPESTSIVEIGFRPLHVGEKTEQFRIMSPELGVFPLELRLIALESAPLDPVRFEAMLGSVDVQTVKVPNYHSSQAIFRCQTTSNEFRVGERVTAAGNDAAAVDVTFEPSSLGQSVAELRIESDQAGNFTYPLIGTSLKPLAQGPYILRAGSTLTIAFKNVLKEAKTFQIYVDNPAFSVKSNFEEIQSGSELKINVTMPKSKSLEGPTGEKELNARYPVMGQLVVECFSPHIKWQYYLKGVVDGMSSAKN